jgi:hypothetical protein
MNDEDRRQWVLNDEGLYNMARREKGGVSAFIRKNRAMIDEVTGNISSGRKQQHYLAYPHDHTCECFGCHQRRNRGSV